MVKVQLLLMQPAKKLFESVASPIAALFISVCNHISVVNGKTDKELKILGQEAHIGSRIYRDLIL